MAAEKIKCRVLLDTMICGVARGIDDIVDLTPRELQVHAEHVDPAPEAVAYAESMKRKGGKVLPNDGVFYCE